jgi:hypothetical protein
MAVNINFKNITVTTAEDNAGIFIGKENAPIGWDILSKSNTAASTGNNTNSLNHSLFIVNDCDGTDAQFIKRASDGFAADGDSDGDSDSNNVVKKYKKTLAPNSMDASDDPDEDFADDWEEGGFDDDHAIDDDIKDSITDSDFDGDPKTDVANDWEDAEFGNDDFSDTEDDDEDVVILQNGERVFPISRHDLNGDGYKGTQSEENKVALHNAIRVKRIGSRNSRYL